MRPFNKAAVWPGPEVGVVPRLREFDAEGMHDWRAATTLGGAGDLERSVEIGRNAAPEVSDSQGVRFLT